MLAPTITYETFQFARGGGLYILKVMCAVQHVELAQRCIRVTAASFSRLFAHEQTFSGATLEPNYHPSRAVIRCPCKRKLGHSVAGRLIGAKCQAPFPPPDRALGVRGCAASPLEEDFIRGARAGLAGGTPPAVWALLFDFASAHCAPFFDSAPTATLPHSAGAPVEDATLVARRAKSYLGCISSMRFPKGSST